MSVLFCVVFVASFRRTNKRRMEDIYTNNILILERVKALVADGISSGD